MKVGKRGIRYKVFPNVVVLKMDGVPDAEGEMFCSDSTTLDRLQLTVTYQGISVGYADCTIQDSTDGKVLIGTIYIQKGKRSSGVYPSVIADPGPKEEVPGGVLIKGAKIVGVQVSVSPNSDPRISPLE